MRWRFLSLPLLPFRYPWQSFFVSFVFFVVTAVFAVPLALWFVLCGERRSRLVVGRNMIVNRRTQRAAVLIVVVAVLALLSLMAATFGMLMSMERAASRNVNEYELARQAAHAGFEYVLQEIRATPRAVLMASGPPIICQAPDDPKVSPFYSMELYRRGGLKVGALTAKVERNPPVHVALEGKSWAEGVGDSGAGQFNLNGMGHLGDYGWDPHKGIRYTSHEASLARVLDSCFLANLTAQDIADIEAIRGAGYWTPAQRQRHARLLADAIVAHRYGEDGLPGTFGREERHHSHLPEYFVWQELWRSSADAGVAVPGHWWGAAGSGCTTTRLYADTSQIGWRNWAVNRWQPAGGVTYLAYVGSGSSARENGTISSSDATSVTLGAAISGAPRPGDRFCIVPDVTGNAVGSADTAPTALLWPDDTLVCEEYVEPRLYFYDNGTSLAPARGTIIAIPSDNEVTLDKDLGDLTGLVIRVVDGAGRGQVRRIVSSSGRTHRLSDDWAPRPAPTFSFDTGNVTVAVSQGSNTITDGNKSWRPHEHVGRRLQIRDESFRIEDNDATTLTLSGTIQESGGYPVGTAYSIVWQEYRIEYGAMADGTGSGAGSAFTADGAPGWAADQFRGCAVNIYGPAANPAKGQTRLVVGNNVNTLTLARAWSIPPPAGSQFVILMPEDFKYRPQNLQGDDRIYRSVAEILPVMVDALQDDGLTVAQAGQVAAILYNGCKDALSVANQTASRKGESCGINDPATDGLDNNDNGVIDDEAGMSAAEQARYLYEQLGLREWAHSNEHAGMQPEAIQWAAQIVANIIDFRDPDDVPTRIEAADIGEGGAYTGAVVGAEGVRLTEILAARSPVWLAANRNTEPGNNDFELVDDGGATGLDEPVPPNPDINGGDNDNDNDLMAATGVRPDLDGWDWNSAGYWEVVDPTGVANPVRGIWAVNNLPVKNGWYAIRLCGQTGDSFLFRQIGGGSGQTGETIPDGTGWGYVRYNSDGRLLAVRVENGRLSFELTALTNSARFYGFQLVEQFVEVTNAAAHDVPLDAIVVDSGAGPQRIALPVTAKIDGASADGNFPVNYGTFVIALSEDAYERNWTRGIGEASSEDGRWGNARGEDYPVVFLGDRFPGETDNSACNDRAKYFLFDLGLPDPASPTYDTDPAAVSPVLKLYSRGQCVASTGSDGFDGDVGACANGRSREKDVHPWSTAWGDYSPAAGENVADMLASQNKLSSTTPGTPRHNLNSSFVALFSAYPDFESRAGFADRSDYTAANYNRVLPVILNRPYATPAWLGLVPTGRLPWRTIDYDPTPSDPPSREYPEELLGLLMSRARTGGMYARINLNATWQTLLEHALRSIMSDSDAARLAKRDAGTVTAGGANTLRDASKTWTNDEWRDYVVNIVQGVGKGQVRRVVSNTADTLTVDRNWDTTPDATSRYRISAGFNWDTLLYAPVVQKLSDATNSEDSGAGTYADDFLDDPDEKEEWARRYSALVDVASTNFKYVVAGLAYREDAPAGEPPVAQVRIEFEIDLSGDQPKVVNFRYVTE